MATLDVSVPHNLSQDEAMRRIKQLLTEMKAEHGDKIGDLKEEWDGTSGKFSFSAMGFALAGTLAVTPTHVRIAGALPLAASFFKNRIETTIRERAATLLA
jgi:hypothetical protein